jgi:hypothetical protein
MKTCSFLEEIINSRKEVFKDVESNMAVEIWKLGNPTRETAEHIDTVKRSTDSDILNLQAQGK